MSNKTKEDYTTRKIIKFWNEGHICTKIHLLYTLLLHKDPSNCLPGSHWSLAPKSVKIKTELIIFQLNPQISVIQIGQGIFCLATS